MAAGSRTACLGSKPVLALLALVSAPAAWGQALPAYALQPGDEIEISVWGEEELERAILVRPDGKFSFPLTGEINAVGRTVSDLQVEVTDKLLPYIPEAVVTISVTGIEGNRVYVIGQVTRPGTFVMNPRLNVLQALSLAGGTTPFAALNDIIVVRGNGADQQVFPFGYDDIKRGRNLQQNIELESGDVVIVP
jgi:polysaccharide export outer membrane protein